MKSVNIGELRNSLSGYIQMVRNVEEVIVKDRNVPVDRIIPFPQHSISDKDARLVASGAMTLPQGEMDWDAFFQDSAGRANVSHDALVQAVIDARGDR
jgi:antitoxin (DNA-binding transcriptional repressor) of toxin-antitoxin stability system